MRPLRDAVRLFVLSEKLAYRHSLDRRLPSVEYCDIRARGNCCCVWITIIADELERRIDIKVSGSPYAHGCRTDSVQRLLALANVGDTFGEFSLEKGSGAVTYSTSALVGDPALDAEAVAFAVRTAAVRFDRLYPGLIQIIHCDTDPDKLWPVIERPDWARINAEFNAMACRPSWGPPGDHPTLGGVLRLPG